MFLFPWAPPLQRSRQFSANRAQVVKVPVEEMGCWGDNREQRGVWLQESTCLSKAPRFILPEYHAAQIKHIRDHRFPTSNLVHPPMGTEEAKPATPISGLSTCSKPTRRLNILFHPENASRCSLGLT